MVEVTEYVDYRGRRPFALWFNGLDSHAATKVAAALARMRRGVTNARSVGAGVLEYRINSGPGYRIYFGRDGETLVVLLGGGTKRRQQADIEAAKRLLQDYRHRRQEEARRWH